MKSTKKRRGRKAMHILGIIVGGVIVLSFLGFIVNMIFFKDELEAIEPYGQLIEIEGKKMHIYSMGEGEEKIILLPGYGIPLPSADFAPLMRELSNDFTVIAVEYFGIGFSDETDTPRTNDNYIEEVRMVLSKAGYNPPYILMPHSASGIYSEYYAAKYPEEVKSIVMLDTTTTAITEGPSVPKFLYSIAKAQQSTGLTRLTIGLVPETKKIENGYTQKEIDDYKKFTFHVLNNTIIDQQDRLISNIREVNSLGFPDDIPVLKIISNDTVKSMSKKNEEAGMEYQLNHINKLGNKVEYKLIQGSHFLYHTNTKEIVELTKDFLERSSN